MIKWMVIDMKKTVACGVLSCVCFILQSTVFRAIDFSGIVPNLLIILTSTYGFTNGERNGLLVGFLCGLLSDIFYGDVIGFYALVYMYIGYANGKFSRVFYPEDIKLPASLIIVSDFIYGLLCYLITFLMRGRLDFSFYFMNIILPEIIYTVVVTIGIYPLILFINRILDKNSKRSMRKFV